MVMTMEPPTYTATIDDAGTARCSRCRQTLAMLSDSGHLWIKHQGLTVLVEGITAAQRVRVWCHRCSKEQAIAA